VTTGLPWSADGETTRLAIRLTPRGGRDALDGVATLSDGSTVLLARVRAVPEDGAANAALIVLIAKALSLAKSDVVLHSGATSRVKIIRLMQPLAALEERLRALVGKG
jgi:uncharacterized protein